jgi:hypothetical protein
VASNLYPTPDPRASVEYHPKWCRCSGCSYSYDLARRRSPLLIGLTIAVIVAGVIAIAIGQVPA